MPIRIKQRASIFYIILLLQKKFVFSSKNQSINPGNDSQDKSQKYTPVQLNIKSERESTEIYEYRQLQDIGIFIAKENSRFNSVKVEGGEIWTGSESDLAKRVTVDGVRNSDFRNINIHSGSDVINFHKVGDKWVRKYTSISINIINKRPSYYANYTNENGIEYFISKSNFMFKGVRMGIKRLWQTEYPDKFANRVGLYSFDSLNNNATIFSLNGETTYLTNIDNNWVQIENSSLLDVRKRDSTSDCDYTPDDNDKTGTYSAKDGHLFKGVKLSDLQVFHFHKEDELPNKVVIGLEGDMVVNVSTFDPKGGTNHFVNLDGKWSYLAPTIQLDASSNESKYYFKYEREQNASVANYTPKLNFKFSRVTEGETLVWEAQPKNHASKVNVGYDNNDKLTNVTLYLPRNKIMHFKKSGDSWSEQPSEFDLDLSKNEACYEYNYNKGPEDDTGLFTPKLNFKFSEVKVGSDKVWECENQGVYPFKVMMDTKSGGPNNATLYFPDKSVKHLHKHGGTWAELSSRMDLDLKKKETTYEFKYSEDGDNGVYTPKLNFRFKGVKVDSQVVWESKDDKVLGKKVVVGYSNETPTHVSVFTTDKSIKHLALENNKWTEMEDVLVLDIKAKGSTYMFNYSPDDTAKTGKYTCNLNFKFKQVKQGDKVIWETNDSKEYGKEVEVHNIGSSNKDLTILLVGGKTLRFKKSGGCLGWRAKWSQIQEEAITAKSTANGTDQSKKEGEENDDGEGDDGTAEPAASSQDVTEGQTKDESEVEDQNETEDAVDDKEQTEAVPTVSGPPPIPPTHLRNSELGQLVKNNLEYEIVSQNSSSVTSVSLDIDSKSSTTEYDYTRDEDKKLDSFKAKGGYKFVKVTRGDDVLWERRDSMGANHVYVYTTSNNKLAIAIYFDDGTRKAFLRDNSKPLEIPNGSAPPAPGDVISTSTN